LFTLFIYLSVLLFIFVVVDFYRLFLFVLSHGLFIYYFLDVSCLDEWIYVCMMTRDGRRRRFAPGEGYSVNKPIK